MLSTPLFRAIPVPLPWPEKPPSRRVAPRGEGAGIQETRWSEMAEASENEKGALETLTEASSVNSGEIVNDAP
jgi:hypothetical protein